MKKFRNAHEIVEFLLDETIPEEKKEELRAYVARHPALERAYREQAEIASMLAHVHPPAPQYLETKLWQHVKEAYAKRPSFYHRVLKRPIFMISCGVMSFLVVWGSAYLLDVPSILAQDYVDMYSDEILEEFPSEDLAASDEAIIELPGGTQFELRGAPRIMYTSQ